MAKNCSKVKNQCKICLDSVTTKTGLQCRGACKRWVHFDCLNFTPGKIQDIKNGVIQINCPCPNCNIEVPKEYLTDPPYTCKNKTCPATQPPRCEEPKCVSNEPGLLEAQLAEDLSSIDRSSSQIDTEERFCCGANKKQAPTLEKKQCCKTRVLTEEKSDDFEQKSSPGNKICKPEISGDIPKKKPYESNQKTSSQNKAFKPETPPTSSDKKSAKIQQKPSNSTPNLSYDAARKKFCKTEPDYIKEVKPENENLKKETHSDSQLSLSILNNKALLSVLQNLCNTIGELSKHVQSLLSKIGEKEKLKPDK